MEIKTSIDKDNSSNKPNFKYIYFISQVPKEPTNFHSSMYNYTFFSGFLPYYYTRFLLY